MLGQSAALVVGAADGTRDPVLAGSVGYAVAVLKAWPTGLEPTCSVSVWLLRHHRSGHAAWQGPERCPVSPIEALFSSAMINGLSGPIMFLIMLRASDWKLTGKLRLPKPRWIVGWMSILAMLAVAVGMLVTTLPTAKKF
jgi:hypothetical protein